MTVAPARRRPGVGGGPAGRAASYYLRRARADFVILDAQDSAGGA
ncbi:NAD(P)-binding protein [Nonomuraea sp. KM88]